MKTHKEFQELCEKTINKYWDIFVEDNLAGCLKISTCVFCLHAKACNKCYYFSIRRNQNFYACAGLVSMKKLVHCYRLWQQSGEETDESKAFKIFLRRAIQSRIKALERYIRYSKHLEAKHETL